MIQYKYSTYFIIGHSAVVGCSKFKKEFPGKIGEGDYSGFDRSEWVKRTNDGHRMEMQYISECSSKGDKEAMESRYGTRFSVLTKLEYYDSVSMAIIDPMHNLFSGQFMNYFKGRNIRWNNVSCFNQTAKFLHFAGINFHE